MRFSKMLNIKWLILFFATLFLSLAIHSPRAQAHRINVFAWVEGDTVFTQSKFSGGGRPKGATIEVYDNEGRKLLEGLTDQDGHFSFKLPQKTALKVVVKAGGGHQGSWQIPIEEVEAAGEVQPVASKNNKVRVAQPDNQKEPATSLVSASSPSKAASEACNCTAEIVQAIKRELDQRLKPQTARLNRMQEALDGPRVADILGGIGYILGLMGLAAYIRFRKNRV